MHVVGAALQAPDVICTALRLLDADEAQLIAVNLLEQPAQAKDVMCTALGLLAKNEARPIARKLLKWPGQATDVICTTLRLLDPAEARPLAKELLEQPVQATEVICTALGLLDPAEARHLAKELLEQPMQATEVICTTLRLLDPAEARPLAKELLEQPVQATEVICTALGLLDPAQARPLAKELLEQPMQATQVICTALGLLDKEAEEFALRILSNWMNERFAVVLRCLNIIPTSTQAEQVVSSLLKNKGDKYRYFNILRYPFHTIRPWRRETRQIIHNWRHNNRLAVASALSHYLDDEEFLRIPCQDILGAWNSDVKYQRQKGFEQVCTAHIIKALAHPQLRKVATREATKMLMYEIAYPGFLGDRLLDAADAVVREGRFPDWTPVTGNEVEDMNGTIMLESKTCSV